MRCAWPRANRLRPITTVAVRTLCLTVAAITAACGGGGESAPAVSAPGNTNISRPVTTSSTAPADLSGPVGLTQRSDFPTLGFAYRYTSNSDGSRPEGQSTPDPAEVISFGYAAADQHHEIKIPDLERGRLTRQYANAYGGWHSLSTAASPTFEVVLYRPGAANPELPLDHTSFGWWEDPIYTPVPAIPRSNNTGYFAYGVPTDPGDVPVSGSRTYTAVVSGATSASLGVWYVFGTASMTFDFSGGGLTGVLRLGVNPGGPGHQDYGDFPFAATQFAVGATRFAGKFSRPGGVEDGFFEGQFTGPQASELMVRWLLPPSGRPPLGSTGSLFGVLAGKRQGG